MEGTRSERNKGRIEKERMEGRNEWTKGGGRKKGRRKEDK